MHFRINFPPSFQYSMVLILLFAVRGYSDPPITDVVEVLYKGNKYYIAECFVDYGTLKTTIYATMMQVENIWLRYLILSIILNSRMVALRCI